MPKTIGNLQATSGWVPAKRTQRATKDVRNWTFINYAPAGSGEVARIVDPIIYVRGGDMSLTGPERDGLTRETAHEGDVNKAAVASFTQISVIAHNAGGGASSPDNYSDRGDITITGDLLYEKKPCSLGVATTGTSCEIDSATGDYKYRNLLGIYSIDNDVKIGYGKGNAQVTTGEGNQGLWAAPKNVIIDAFIMAPRGVVGYTKQIKDSLDDSEEETCAPEKRRYPKGRVTFRGMVETEYAGRFKIGCHTIHQSYILDNRAIHMIPPGFPNNGGSTKKDTDALTSLKVTMANSDAKGHVSSANLIGEWKQARR